MLEEYLCLGGNEVANNARTYGYATTDGCPLTWFRCEPCESLHDVTGDWIPPTYRTYEIGRNIYPDPGFVNGTYLNAGVSWSRTFPGEGVARLERIDANPGRIVDFIVGTEMPNSSKTVTIRFQATASQAFNNITVAARPNVSGSTGEWATASINIPAGTSTVEVTGPSFAGTSSTSSSGITLLDNTPSTGLGATLEISEVMISPRPALNFVETRRNFAIGTGAATGTTTGAITRTVGGAGVKGPFVLARTNNALDPRATGLNASAWMSGSLSTLSTVTDGDGTTWVRSTRNGTGSTGLIGIQIGTAQLASTSYRVRFRVRSSVATSIAVQLRSTLLNSAGSVQIATVAVPAGESILDVSGASSATAPTTTAGVLLVNATTAIGATLDVTEVLHELVTTSQSRGFFDGNTADDVDNTYAWTGTVNLSSSTLTAREPLEVEPGSLRVTQTTQGNTSWSDSLVYYPGSITTSGTAVTQVVPVVPGDVVRGYVEWRANRTRRMLWRWAWYDASNTIIGSLSTAGFTSPEPPAEAGEWNPVLVYTNTAPDNAAFARLEIRSLGSSSTGSSSFQGMIAGDWAEFRNALITKNDSNATFFDGATLAPDGYTQYQWTGTANASQSRELQASVLPALPPFFDGDSVEPTPDDTIRWTGTPNASTSIWERRQVETPGHSTGLPYDMSNISDAPWYDQQAAELTGRFYGVYLLSIDNINSSTRSASVTEGILDGGVVGLVRYSTREMRVRALLTADGEDALEYGLAWLNSALAADGCSTHGASCGAVDLNFFAFCPPLPDPSTATEVDTTASRHMHNVTVISGPLVEQKLQSNNDIHYGYIVEWTMVAGTPWVFSQTKEVAVNLQPPVVVQDVPYNLVPFPSAELSNGTVTLATNYSTNPSVETNATGWSVSNTVITPVPTGARSTEIAAQGTASFKASVTTTNSGTNGTIIIYQDVTLPAYAAGQRFSANMWAFGAVVSGTATLTDIEIKVDWLAAGPSYISSSILGTVPVSGGARSGSSLLRPATATMARVQATLRVASWSTGAVLNLFADAVAVTIP